MNGTTEHDAQRTPKIAVTCVLFLMLLIAALGLKPGGSQTMLRDALQTSGHFAFFGELAFCVALASPIALPWLKTRRWAQYLVGFSASVAVGAALEYAQSFIPGRFPNVADLIFDVLGAAGAICLLIAIHQVGRQGLPRRVLQIFAALVFLAISVLGAYPFVSCVLDYRGRQAAVPLLADIGERWSGRFLFADYGARLSGRPVPAEWQGGDNVLGLRFPSGYRYPGFGLREPYPDWSTFETFAFDVYSPADASFEIRIQDTEHNEAYDDRFNQRLPITAGFQTIRIPIRDIQNGPKHRDLDTSNVAGFKVFTVDPSQDIDLWVGNLRLED